MNVLTSFVPLLVLFLIQDAAARPRIYFPSEVPALPTAILVPPPPPPPPLPVIHRIPVVGGSGYASGLNYNTTIGGIINGHTGNNNGPQIGNNAGVMG